MSEAAPLSDLFNQALRDLPAGLCFAGVLAADKSHAALHAGGRVAARQALAQAGFSGQAELTVNSHGAADWPSAWLGSISHSKGICIAAVAGSENMQTLGIDLEQLGRLRPQTLSRIATQAELEHVDEQDVLTHATILFSLKEAFYKAQHPLYHATPRFQDLELRWCEGASKATVIQTSGVIKNQLHDYCKKAHLHAWISNGWVLSLCCTGSI